MGVDVGFNISNDEKNNVYITGYFSLNSTNSIIFSPYTLYSPLGSGEPMFIVKYDSAGNVLCASSLPSGGLNNSVTADDFGNAYIGGGFRVNPFIVGNDTLMLGVLLTALKIFL